MSERPVSVRLSVEASATGSANINWSEKSATLMAWAVRADTRRPVYVVTIPREEKGLDCKCVCPACGGTLQAVNNGWPREHYLKPNTPRPFFRHHTGQQRAECRLGVAQLAALRLLIESREIDLPAPSSRRSVTGASGAVYTQTSMGVSQRVNVVAHRWIDEHSASIRLDNGKVVLVKLSGRSNHDDDGTADAVISIKVDDPEVSTWPPDKILEQAQLDGRWMCWERHWEDDSLQADALARAEDEARRLLDLTPAGLTMPDGLTPLQRSESVLHWVIKDILAAAGKIKTPAVQESIARRMPNGQHAQRIISLPEMNMTLTNVRVEHRLGSLIPDVMCRAVDDAGRFKAIDLMIEVAVTHRVDEVKRSRIVQLQLACIELDVDLLSGGGRLTVDRLKTMVLGDSSNKRWINHPALHRQVEAAEAELDLMAAEIDAAFLRDWSRRNRFNQLSTEQAVGEYLNLLRAFWRTRSAAEVTKWEYTPAQMADLLAERGLKGLDTAEFSGQAGILRRIDAIRIAAEAGTPSESAYLHFKTIYESVEDRWLVTLILIAIREFKPVLLPDCDEALKLARKEIKSSIEQGEATFARPTKWDRALSLMFPEMATGLAQEVGTAAYAARIVRQRNDKARVAESARLKLEAEARASALLQESAERHANEISDAIHRICANFQWGPINDGFPVSADDSIKMVLKATRNNRPSGKQISEKVNSAWAARKHGQPLATWLKSQNAKTDSEVYFLRRLLEDAWLVFPTRK